MLACSRHRARTHRDWVEVMASNPWAEHPAC